MGDPQIYNSFMDFYNSAKDFYHLVNNNFPSIILYSAGAISVVGIAKIFAQGWLEKKNSLENKSSS